jgi:GR25 family glycosyltransferase involved in LPS biosynthesis
MVSDLVDRAVCINLVERKDRFQKARARFDAVGLSNVEFYFAEHHPRGALYGCFDSHRACIQKAYNDGICNLLIFEDDVQFKEGWGRVFGDADVFLRSSDSVDYDALFLGGRMLYVQDRTATANIWRAKCMMAHAYIISRRGMKSFLEKNSLFEQQIDRYGFDITFMSVWRNMFVHMPTNIIVQDGALGTDNYWVAGIPNEYVPWFQTVVVPKYFRWSQPLVRWNWWRHSFFGRHYVWGIDDAVIDDGVVLLKGLWLFDTFALMLIMLCTVPPFGYLTIARDLPRMVACTVYDRLMRARGDGEKSIEKEENRDPCKSS